MGVGVARLLGDPKPTLTVGFNFCAQLLELPSLRDTFLFGPKISAATDRYAIKKGRRKMCLTWVKDVSYFFGRIPRVLVVAASRIKVHINVIGTALCGLIHFYFIHSFALLGFCLLISFF